MNELYKRKDLLNTIGLYFNNNVPILVTGFTTLLCFYLRNADEDIKKECDKLFKYTRKYNYDEKRIEKSLSKLFHIANENLYNISVE